MPTLPVPNLDANSVIFFLALAFTALTLHLSRSFFTNGASGPVGSMNLKAVTSLVLLNSLGLVALTWGFVFVALRAASSFDRVANYIERQERQNAGTTERD